MEKWAFEVPLNPPFDLGNMKLHSRKGEIWREGGTMVEYAPFPGLHHSLGAYQKYLISELEFLSKTPKIRRDIFFHGLIQGGDKDLQRLKKFRVIKVKCARRPLAEDIEYFHFLTQQLPKAKFRMDANRLWSAQDLKTFAGQVDLKRVDYFEEPTLHSEELIKDYPIALDETIRIKASRPEHIMKKSRAIVLKPHLHKDIQEVLSLIEWGQQNQIPIVLSSLFNSSVGTQNLLRLACLCKIKTFHGLDPFFHLGDDTVGNPLLAQGDYFPQDQVCKKLVMK